MRVAMIGTGGIAARHLQTLAARREVRLVGHLSRERSRAEAAARRWGGDGFTDLGALLDRARPEAVWITVPPHAHGPLELELVARGVPFLVEKPLSADRELAVGIGEAVEAAGLVTAVGYQWRAMDTVAAAREALADRPVALVVGAWHDATPAPAWWRRREESGGQIVEQATHLFDLARLLVGEAHVLAAAARRLPRATYPDADVDSVSAALLAFEGGAVGSFSATGLLAGAAEVQLQLTVEGMQITLERERATFDLGRERRRLRLGRDPIAEQNRVFLEAVRRDDPTLPYSSYRDALKSHHLAHDIQAAADAGDRPRRDA